MVNDGLVARMKALGAIPTPFSSYVYYHGEKMHFYGQERLKNMFALRSMLDAGIRPTQASDYTASPYEPMMALQSEVTRTDTNGTVWGANQRITIQEAIRIRSSTALTRPLKKRSKGQSLLANSLISSSLAAIRYEGAGGIAGHDSGGADDARRPLVVRILTGDALAGSLTHEQPRTAAGAAAFPTRAEARGGAARALHLHQLRRSRQSFDRRPIIEGRFAAFRFAVGRSFLFFWTYAFFQICPAGLLIDSNVNWLLALGVPFGRGHSLAPAVAILRCC